MSGAVNQRLIPANTTLLQPASRFFRISDLIAYGLQTASTARASGVTGLTAAEAVAEATANLQTQITNLQNQIDSLHARLAAAGIA